jgi:hypothetical protein
LIESIRKIDQLHFYPNAVNPAGTTAAAHISSGTAGFIKVINTGLSTSSPMIARSLIERSTSKVARAYADVGDQRNYSHF